LKQILSENGWSFIIDWNGNAERATTSINTLCLVLRRKRLHLPMNLITKIHGYLGAEWPSVVLETQNQLIHDFDRMTWVKSSSGAIRIIPGQYFRSASHLYQLQALIRCKTEMIGQTLEIETMAHAPSDYLGYVERGNVESGSFDELCGKAGDLIQDSAMLFDKEVVHNS
jgi:hypothetical protein